MAGNDRFMSDPLVLWIETFKLHDSKALKYKDLYDGVFLNDVMQQIDTRPNYGNVQRNVEDVSVRISNWDILVRNIRAYYKDVLQQLIVWKLPNIQTICRDPEKETSFAEVRRTLLLILGCAVQCEMKESIIENIKRLELHVQAAMVEHIQEITDDSDAVVATEPTDNLEAHNEKIIKHLARLIKERDEQAESLQEVTQERDFYMSQAQGIPVPAPVGPDKHHVAVELAELKAKLRHLRQELEDKSDQVSDLKEELNYATSDLAKLKNENAELVQEARTTRLLRDELDIVKEKASKVDMLEKEITKYKERLNELEFYKARTEELREEAQILEETRTMLEEQLATSRQRVETVVELENELMKYRQQIEELYTERDLDRERIEMLTEENARLEFEKKSSMNESASLEQELEDAKARVGGLRGSLSDQLTETSNAKILRLELENQRLSAKLREMQDGALIHSAEVNLQLEKENQRLAKRMEKLQETVQELTQKLLTSEEDQHKATAEGKELHQALEMVKENSERQVKELEQENEQLTQTIEILRERNEKTNDARMKELERDNKRLTETVSTKNTELSKLEFENRQLQRSYSKLKENVDRISELENENAELEKENSDLHQKIAALQHSCEKLERLEQEFSDVEVENRKLQKTVESLQASLQKKEQLEEEKINLTVEKQKLERTLENLKNSSTKLAELESEKELMNKELHQVKKLLESQKASRMKQEQLEFDLLDMDNELQRVQKTLDVTTKRLQQLEKDNADIESENDQLQKQIETLKMSSKRLEDREKVTEELEGELDKVQKDKAALEKENRKLKQSLDMKELSLDEMTTSVRTLEQDHKALKRSYEQMLATSARVKELEKENREMFQEMNGDKKTVATLREELVKEKIQTQELHNELEKLHQQLEHIGINTQKLAMSEQSQDENRLKALESLMHETLKKNSEIKDDKIQALETRLEESKGRNLKMQEDLKEARREMESLRQRYEEEVASSLASQMSSSKPSEIHRTTVHHLQSSPANRNREMIDLKDRVELERNNATLMAENNNLQANIMSMSTQCQKLEKQATTLQSQNSSLQNHVNSLQSYNAQLQVENTTLKSKCASLGSEKSELQTQLNNIEIEHDALIQRQEDLSSKKDALSVDYEKLQHLHKQLSLEYEALISEHGSLKSIHKAMKSELKDTKEQLDTFLQGRDDVNKIREVLEKERQQLQMEQRSLGNLQISYNHLRDEHDHCRERYDRLSKDYTDSLASHKALKSEFNTLQLKLTEQSGQLSLCKDQLNMAIMEMQKAENSAETLFQIKERLENENETLLQQIRQVLNQNQDLLTQVLNSKDHFAEEEKGYMEKLADLRRQKERLEEKIMEHYKNRSEGPKKHKSIGAIIARKARNIISRAPRRSKSRPDLTTINDSSSQGSGSHADSTEHDNSIGKRGTLVSSAADSDSELCNSQETTPDSTQNPKLTFQKRSWAKSQGTLSFIDSKETKERTANSLYLRDEPLVETNSPPKGQTPRGCSITLQISYMSGAKSTEDIPRDVSALEDDTDGGFSTSSLPQGYRSRQSPGSEMLTLHQFLSEVNTESSHFPADKWRHANQLRSQEDSESRSSENSDLSINKASQRQHTAQQHQPLDITNTTLDRTLSFPAQDANPLNASGPQYDSHMLRMSRVSSGSGSGSTADIVPLSPPGSASVIDMVLTSTPSEPGQRGRWGPEDRGRWQDGSERLSQNNSQPKYAVPQQSRPESRRSITSDFLLPPYTQHSGIRPDGPDLVSSTPPSYVPRTTSNRELPPTPVERELRRESVPPEHSTRRESGEFSLSTDRPDPPIRIGLDPNRRLPGNLERPRPMPRSQSVGPRGILAPDSKQPGGVGNDQGMGGRQTLPFGKDSYVRDQSPAVGVRDSDQYSSNSKSASFFSQHGSPGMQNQPTLQQQPQTSHRPTNIVSHQLSYQSLQHPASAQSHLSPNQTPHNQTGNIHHDLSNSNSITNLKQDNTGSSRMRPEPMVTTVNGSVRVREQSYSQHGNNTAERPKSVPPHLFDKYDNTDPYDKEIVETMSGPPARQPRDARDFSSSQASLVHEPGNGQASGMRGTTQYYRHPGIAGQQQTSGYGGRMSNHLPSAGSKPDQGLDPQWLPGSHYSPTQGGSPMTPSTSRPSDSSQNNQQFNRNNTVHSSSGQPVNDLPLHHKGNVPSIHQRPQSSMGFRPQNSSQSALQSPQQMLFSGNSRPGPQYPNRAALPNRGFMNRPEQNTMLRPSVEHPSSSAPLQPQIKVASTGGGRSEPSVAPKTAVGEEQPRDQVKQNSVWRGGRR